MLVTLYDLTTSIQQHRSPQETYLLVKELRNSGVPSSKIIASLYELYETDLSEDSEDDVENLIFALEGRCNPQISLA